VSDEHSETAGPPVVVDGLDELHVRQRLVDEGEAGRIQLALAGGGMDELLRVGEKRSKNFLAEALGREVGNAPNAASDRGCG
jgi:D-alanyl-D-alanine carboxypeptidase